MIGWKEVVILFSNGVLIQPESLGFWLSNQKLYLFFSDLRYTFLIQAINSQKVKKIVSIVYKRIKL